MVGQAEEKERRLNKSRKRLEKKLVRRGFNAPPHMLRALPSFLRSSLRSSLPLSLPSFMPSFLPSFLPTESR